MKYILLLVLFPMFSLGQDIISIHIDHGALHCPYLSPRFQDRFSQCAEVDSVHIDRQTSIGTLYLSDGMDLTDEQITQIIVHNVGYPVQEIKAIIRNGQ